jgi:TRAP-type C4-dicarboxylate transport system permease large subunit
LCTPPVGAVLVVGCGIAKTSIQNLIKPLMPMYLAMIVALLLVMYVPAITEWLPMTFDLYEK